MRRRLEMLQAASGYELVYESASGVVPDSSKWQTTDRYSGASTINGNDNAVHIVDGQLKVAAGHVYAQKAIYVQDHPSADNCYAAVEFAKTGTLPFVCIHLTDGSKSAMGICRIGDGMVNIHTCYLSPWNGTRVWVGYKDVNLFEVEKVGDKAYYYLNDRLVYTQNTLFNKSSIATGGAGTATDPQLNGLVTRQENAIAFGYGVSQVYVTKMIYRES